MDANKADKTATTTTTTTAMETVEVATPTVEKEEVSAEVLVEKQHWHIFDMRIEFSTNAHMTVDTFSIVLALKGFTNQLLATNVVFILSQSGDIFLAPCQISQSQPKHLTIFPRPINRTYSRYRKYGHVFEHQAGYLSGN